MTGKAAWVTRSRRIAQTRIMAAEQKRARHARTFRAAALGQLTLTELARSVFGIDKPAEHVRHGETLDAP